MRDSKLAASILLVVIMLVTAVMAQTPGPRPDPVSTFVVGNAPAPPAPRVSAATVVERIMSFDRNKDGKVGRDELPERMQDLVGKGDADRDGSLDEAEITGLATNAPAAGRGGLPIGFRGRGAGQLGQVRLVRSPGRAGIEGVLDDLKLPAAKHDEAMASLTTVLEGNNQAIDTAASKLKLAMKEIVSAEQLTHFETTLDGEARQRLGGRGAQPPLLLNGLRILTRADLEGAVARFDLPFAQKAQAQSAVQTYRDQTRQIMDSTNAELIASMKRHLSDDELQDFKAALDRQGPIRFVVGGLVTGRGVVGGPPAGRSGRP